MDHKICVTSGSASGFDRNDAKTGLVDLDSRRIDMLGLAGFAGIEIDPN
jgi:hypothetical protein